MKITFVKYSGCGNDFVLIDNRDEKYSFVQKAVPKLCHRQLGIGADGVILLEKGKRAPYRMRIFNADGSEAEMCGNGLRCLAHFIHTLHPTAKQFTIDTMHSTMEVAIQNGCVSVTMPPPAEINSKKLIINDEEFHLHLFDTGVPHAVMFVDDLHHPTLLESAPAIRHHPTFPKGTNVNYAKKMGHNMLAVRTYERGVEGETLACGTGAVATALAAAHIHGMASPVIIHTCSGDSLHVEFEISPKGITKVVMTGPAVKVFEGNYEFHLH